MKGLYKFLITFALVALAFPATPFIATALIAFVAPPLLKKVFQIGGKAYRSARDMNDKVVSNNQAKKAHVSKYVTKGQNGHMIFNEASLPANMTVTPSYNNTWALSYDGLPYVMNAALVNNGKDILFSSEIGNDNLLNRVKELIARNPNSGITLSPDARSFNSDSLEAMTGFIDQLYPRTEKEVVRNTVMTNRYIVKGVSSYEEAVKYVQEHADSLTPVECSYKSDSMVDGKFVNTSSHGELSQDLRFIHPVQNTLFLEQGTFIVDQSQESSEKAVVAFRGTSDAGICSNAWMAFTTPEVNKTVDTSSDTKFSESFKDEERYMRLPDGRQNFVFDYERLRDVYSNCAVTFSFEDSKALDRFLAEGSVPAGTVVNIDREYIPSESRDGSFCVSVPLDAALFSTLVASGSIAGSFKEAYGKFGLTDEQALASAIQNGFRVDGHSSVRATSDINLSDSKALVNGCPVDDVRSAAESAYIFSGMNDRRRAEWMRESSKIESANLYIDRKEKALVLESKVHEADGRSVFKRQKMSLDDAAQKGWITKSQLKDEVLLNKSFSPADAKDLLMRLNPSYFSVYSGTNAQRNPLAAVFGRKASESTARSQAQKNNNSPVDAAKKAARRPVTKKGPAL